MDLDNPEQSYYKDFPECETEEELHRAIFRRDVEMWCEENNIEVSNRYSQWLSTELVDGVLDPRPLHNMQCLEGDMYGLTYDDCEETGKWCCVMHEQMIRFRYNCTQGYLPTWWPLAKEKQPRYF
jgi:hypothetical protein